MILCTHQLTGSAHGRCEDVLFYAPELPRFGFAGLADGQSGQSCCIQGGALALTALCDCLRQTDLPQLQRRSLLILRRELCQAVQHALHQAAQAEGTPLSSFASTLCALAWDRQDDLFLLVHLGDGCILARKEQKWKQLSSPENGMTDACTYLTASSGACAHLRLRWGHLSRYRQFLLCSDGAYAPLRSDLTEPTEPLPFPRLCQLLDETAPEDDATLLLLSQGENATHFPSDMIY